MPFSLELFLGLALFAFGMRLSAFFSGSETGFYRMSYLRISLDARAGDTAAQRLLWFAKRPAAFVATTLVGNNVANYLTTLAIGMMAFLLFPQSAGSTEIVGTLLLAPIIFIGGELLPKNLLFRAPMHFMKRDAWKLQWCYRLLLPVSFPLILISRLFERFAEAEDGRRGFALARNRLTQAFSEGHKQGVLSQMQNQLVHGLMTITSESVGKSATNPDVVFGCSVDSTREELLATARKFGISAIALHRAGNPRDWFAYVRLVDVAVTQRPVSALIRPMPEISANRNKLDALLQLRAAGEDLGIVVENGRTVGVISSYGLAEQLFRPAPPTAGAVQ